VTTEALSLPGDLADFTAPDWLEAASPAEIIGWAWSTFGSDVVATCSFGDALLPHHIAMSAPDTAVVMLDTQYLFAETSWFAERLAARLSLNLTVVGPKAGVTKDDLWQENIDQCCFVRKVEPLQRALAGRKAWISGLRRSESPSRANAPIASYDPFRQLVKINPLANMTDDEAASYLAEHDLPAHPLAAKGYPSIGCWPCTNPVAPGEDPRSGRWAGSGKTECGLHLPG
jgi:phosphoadenosine phosphosulfate reductase